MESLFPLDNPYTSLECFRGPLLNLFLAEHYTNAECLSGDVYRRDLGTQGHTDTGRGGVILGSVYSKKWIRATAHAKCLRWTVDIGDGLKHNLGVHMAGSLHKEGTPSHTPQIHHGPHSNVTLNF